METNAFLYNTIHNITLCRTRPLRQQPLYRRRCLGFTQTTSTGCLGVRLACLLRVVSGAALPPPSLLFAVQQYACLRVLIVDGATMCSVCKHKRRNRLPAPPMATTDRQNILCIVRSARKSPSARTRERKTLVGDRSGVDRGPYGCSHRR